VGFAYNIGVYHSSGELIAFCDDRDIWYPEKLESQISAMETSGCGMSCTEAHAGHGRTLDKKILYHGEHYRKDLDTIFKSSDQSWGGKIPELITLSLMNVHNLIIGGTVLMKKSLFNQIGGMTVLTMGREGYDCWKRCLEYTNCVHVEKPGIYYDLSRGNY
jgi:glycosyltransferase involved in cell wall biosynthesis